MLLEILLGPINLKVVTENNVLEQLSKRLFKVLRFLNKISEKIDSYEYLVTLSIPSTKIVFSSTCGLHS